MRKNPRKILIGAGVLVLSAPLLVLGLGLGLAAPLPPSPDGDMAILLPDGSTTTLDQLIAAAPAEAEAPADADSAPANPSPSPPQEEGGPASAEALAELLGEDGPIHGSWLRSPDDRDLYRLGRQAAADGNPEQAAALLRSVPSSHPQYARAQRFLGWDLYTQQLDQPRVGLAYANQSVRSNPFDGNAWQDIYRVLGASMFGGD